MEKILMAIDAEQIDIVAVDFACYIANLTRSKLVAILFQKSPTEAAAAVNAFNTPYEYLVTDITSNLATSRERYEVKARQFEESCMKRGISCEVLCCDAKKPAQKVIYESRFADLVIIKAETSFEKDFEGVPTNFATEVLAGSECPVLIAPPGFDGIEEIIFAYDGSRSAVFAIKQFTYLLPEFSDTKAILLEVNNNDSKQVAEKEKIGELLKMHYSGIGFQVLQGRAEEELFKYLISKKNSFVVMGAFGRGIFSEMFKNSTAGLVLKTVDCPFFIAHH